MAGPKAIIHLDRLVKNYRILLNAVQGKRLVSVVKANGYGHGAVSCANALERVGCDFFAVFTFNEALELREKGIKSEILVFSKMNPDHLAEAVTRDIILNLSWSDDLDLLLEFYQKTGTCPRMHLKVDTGMTRLGVPLDDVYAVLDRLKKHPEIRCEGIYSHLATADEGDLSYAHQQGETFHHVLEQAEKSGYDFKHVHLSNSGAVINLDQTSYSLVRVGMLLYGAFPSDEVPQDLPVKPVMEFKAPIVTVRKVLAGTQVSYGGVYTAERETTIGVIECGFADGYPRPWYEKGHVLYQGKKYKIAGRICMDQFMVDFEGTEPNIGDDVLLIGEGAEGKILMEEIAQAIGSTPYVLSTAIGGRTQYIYNEN